MLLGAVFPAAGAAGLGTIRAEVGYDDNVTDATQEDDPLGAVSLLVAPEGGWRWRAGKNGSLTLRGSLDVAVVFEYDRLSGADPGLELAWRRKTRLGADAPWFALSAAATYQAYRSEIRRGTEAEASFRFGHPATPRYTYRLEATAYRRDAESEAFTQDAWWLTFHNDIVVSRSGLLYVRYQYRQGQITSSAEPRRALILATSPEERVPDDAFPGRVAYRLDATTQVLRVGWNQALGDRKSLDLSYEFRRSAADLGSRLDYDNNLVRVTYLYRF
ncbi:MAG: hypothetical protein PVF68_07810 [Acidobacteriota bacterium]